MFKKIALVGIFLVLLVFSTLVSATELRIDAEVQLKEKPVKGDKFNVHIFATPIYSDLEPPEQMMVGETKIKLKTTNPAMASFTGDGTSSHSSHGPTAFTTGGLFHLKAENGVKSISSPPGRTYLGSLKMEIKSEGGSFSVEVVSGESSVVQSTSTSPITYYNVFTSNFPVRRFTQIVNKDVSPICVPSSFCGSNFCGFADDSCGGFVQCSKICGSGEACVNNFCVSAVSQLSSVFDQQACQAVVNLPDGSSKVLLKNVAETLSDWDKSCTTNTDCKAGYSCTDNKCTATKLSILSPIFAALTDWLDIKFP